MRSGQWMASVAALIALQGCGGGGSGGTATTATPAPTPAPTPSPTPIPTPPAVSYPSPSDYSTAYSLTSGLGYAVDQFVPDNGALPTTTGVYLLPDGQSTRLTFAPQPESAEISYAGATAAWTGSDRTASSPRTYQRDVDTLVIGYSGRAATYVTKTAWRRFLGAATIDGVAGRRARISFGVVGAATVPAELPGGSAEFRGSAQYWGGPRFDRFTGLTDSTAFVTLRDGGVVSGAVNVNESSSGGRNTTLIVSGRLDPLTGLITGTLANPEQTFTGTLKGQVYGPQGREVALAFQARRPGDAAELLGEFVGQR